MPTPPRAKAPPHVQAQAQAAARSQRRLESTFDVQATTIPPGLFGRHTTHINAKTYVAASSDIRYFLVDKSRAAQAAKDKATALGKSMVSWSTILATPTADTPGACLYLHHDNRRYLFGNISEGTQRLMVQRKVSLTKTEEIFVTGPVTWHNVGGLLGMVLSIAEGISSTLKGQLQPSSKPGKSQTKNSTPSKPPSVGVHGAENLAHMIATARRFVFRKGIPIRPREARANPRAINPENHAPDWQDENIKVWYVPLYAEGEQRSTRKRDRDTTTDASDGERTLAGKELVDSVVNHMFDSDWQFDALFETTLHQAQLPATLFVKDAQGHLKQYDGPLPGSGAHVKDIPVLVRKPWPGATVANLPRTTPVRQSMCYIVKNHPRRGKFNPQAAQKYGVAKQDYKVLTSGGSVQGADGTLVTPDMVVAATVEGNGFAMVDIPDPTYISSLLARPEWTTQEIFKNILTINWLLGPGVLDDPRLQDFMAKHTSVRHTVFSSDTCPNHLALESPAAIQIKLHRLDPDRFPIPRYSNVSPYQEESRTLPIEIARPGATVSLAPQAVFKDDNIVPFLDTTEALNTLDDEIIKLADAARAKIADKDFLSRIEQAEKDIPSRDAEVIPLGTGSAVPSKYRNVSSTLVRVPGHGSYIFDAGENTLGSLKRLYGPEGAQEVLRDLKLVWISHLHADHHLGTASVIRGWRDATAASEAHKDARLSVASHWQMLSWLREYADVEDYGFDRLRLLEVKKEASSKTAHPLVFSTAAGHQDVVDTGGLARIDAAHVDHCFGAYAVALTWPSGLKVAYSGDCRPSDDFVRIGRGATLLIHESTFDDGLEGEAKAKKHSTMGEALDVARRMGARRVLLTHFSQRYPKIPIFDAEPPERDGGGDDMAVLIAFDLMRVKLGEFRQAAAFLPALQGLLNEEEKKKDD